MSPRSLLALLLPAALVPVTVALTAPPAAADPPPMTITTVERGSGLPVPGACYHVEDLDQGGGIAAQCDDGTNGDVRHDGTVVLRTTGDGCGSCRIVQSLPNLAPGVPTDHLVEPPLEGPWGGPYQFQSHLKPYLRVGFVDARTGTPLPGACIAVNKSGQSGAVFGGCDGEPGGGAGDQDGSEDAVVQTRRLPSAGTYTVAQTTRSIPQGYLRAGSVDLEAPPAETGDVVTHTFALVGDAGLVVRTVNRRGRLLAGACYAVRDTALGAGLGRICDGSDADDDRRADGIVRLRRLPAGHTYVLDQRRAPRGFRLQEKNKTITTVSRTASLAQFTNVPR